MSNRKAIVFVATSLDGYIAKSNDDLSFLSLVEQKGEDYGYEEFIKTIDTVVLGRKTYDWVTKNISASHYGERTTYVATRTPRPSVGNTHFYNGNLTELVTKLKSESTGKNLFVDGGAEVVNSLVKDKLIDEFVISIIPVILGGGVRLFKEGLSEQKLKLITSKHFEKGLVQIHYKLEDHSEQ